MKKFIALFFVVCAVRSIWATNPYTTIVLNYKSHGLTYRDTITLGVGGKVKEDLFDASSRFSKYQFFVSSSSHLTFRIGISQGYYALFQLGRFNNGTLAYQYTNGNGGNNFIMGSSYTVDTSGDPEVTEMTVTSDPTPIFKVTNITGSNLNLSGRWVVRDKEAIYIPTCYIILTQNHAGIQARSEHDWDCVLTKYDISTISCAFCGVTDIVLYKPITLPSHTLDGSLVYSDTNNSILYGKDGDILYSNYSRPTNFPIRISVSFDTEDLDICGFMSVPSGSINIGYGWGGGGNETLTNSRGETCNFEYKWESGDKTTGGTEIAYIRPNGNSGEFVYTLACNWYRQSSPYSVVVTATDEKGHSISKSVTPATRTSSKAERSDPQASFTILGIGELKVE